MKKPDFKKCWDCPARTVVKVGDNEYSCKLFCTYFQREKQKLDEYNRIVRENKKKSTNSYVLHQGQTLKKIVDSRRIKK